MCHDFSGCKKFVWGNNFSNISTKRPKLITIFCFIAVFILMHNIQNNIMICFAENNTGGVVRDNLEIELEKNTNDILNDIDFADIDKIISDLQLNEGNFADFSSMVSAIMSGELDFSFDSIVGVFKDGFVEFVKDLLSPLCLIFLIILLSNIVSSYSSKKMSSSIHDVVRFACLSVIVIVVSVLLKNVIDVAKGTLQGLIEQVNAICPILLTLMVSVGGVTSSASLSPIILFFSNNIANIFYYILFPIFVLIVIISIISNLSKDKKVGDLGTFFGSLFKWILGTVCTIFMAVLSINGILSIGKDGLSVKAAKYAIKNYIPFLGGYISEGFEIVKVGSLVVKNAIGLGSIILIFFTLVKPLLYLCSLSLGFKLVAGVSGVIDNTDISKLLFKLSNALKYLIAILVGVACMYLLILLFIIGSGNMIL